MGSLVGTILNTTLNFKRDSYVHFSGALIWPILQVANVWPARQEEFKLAFPIALPLLHSIVEEKSYK